MQLLMSQNEHTTFLTKHIKSNLTSEHEKNYTLKHVKEDNFVEHLNAQLVSLWINHRDELLWKVRDLCYFKSISKLIDKSDA